MSDPLLEIEPLDQHAQRLIRLVDGVPAPVGWESSFRLCPAGLFANRFLLSMGRRAISDELVRELCRTLGMPDRLWDIIEDPLQSAGFLHFGFEQGASGCLYKVYVESTRPRPEDAGASNQAVLQHVAVKWDAGDSERSHVTRYYWQRGLDLRDILARLQAVYGVDSDRPLEIARDVALLAAGRMPAAELHFMDVSEDRTPRRSFDFKLADAALRLGDLQPFLRRMCEHFSIAPQVFQQFAAPRAAATVGHLAGGVHRNGQDFFNVYYGARPHRPAAADVAGKNGV